MTIRGFGWPMRSNETQVPAAVVDRESIAASVRTILDTPQGTRPMRRLFGTRALDTVFENADPVAAALLRRTVLSGLQRSEPRIRVDQVRVELQDSLVLVYVVYTWNLRQETVNVQFARPR